MRDRRLERRRFTWKFKLEAMKLVQDHGVSFGQAWHELNVQENALRK
jgi:transposase-like protein